MLYPVIVAFLLVLVALAGAMALGTGSQGRSTAGSAVSRSLTGSPSRQKTRTDLRALAKNSPAKGLKKCVNPNAGECVR